MTVLPDQSFHSLNKSFGVDQMTSYMHELQDSVNSIGLWQKAGGFNNDFRVVPNYLTASSVSQMQTLQQMLHEANDVGVCLGACDKDLIPYHCVYAAKLDQQAQVM